MNTSRHHYCRAMLSFLRERAQCLGAVANAPAAAEALDHFKSWSPPNQACLHVDLRALRCEWSRNMPLLGLPEACRKGQGLSLQALLSAIHPNFLNAYSVFAQAAYGPLPGGCPPHSGDYISLRLPLYQPSARRYTVVEQTSYPIALDAEGRLLSHINRLVRRVMNERKRSKFCTERGKKRRHSRSYGVPLFESKSGINEVQHKICRLQPFDDPAEQVYYIYSFQTIKS